MRIPRKESMKLLGQGVYTDGSLAFKFYRPYFTDRHPEIEVEALRRVQDIPRTQRFVHYDGEEKVLVTGLVNGYLLDEDSDEFRTGILHYTPWQIQELFRTLIAMRERGVAFDAHARNLFYNPAMGFTPIDYDIPIKAQISLSGLIFILSLKGIPVKIDDVQLADFPQKGLNRQNHPDVRKMIYDAFREVDQDQAAEEINRLENMERIVRDSVDKLTPQHEAC